MYIALLIEKSQHKQCFRFFIVHVCTCRYKGKIQTVSDFDLWQDLGRSGWLSHQQKLNSSIQSIDMPIPRTQWNCKKMKTGSEIIKLFSCLIQLSIKFKMLIKFIKTFSIFQTQKSLKCYFPAHKCEMPTICWHFNIYEQENFMLS